MRSVEYANAIIDVTNSNYKTMLQCYTSVATADFFSLWSNFRNICCITVFSIHEHSSFKSVMRRVSSQYSWVGLGLIKLFEI